MNRQPGGAPLRFQIHPFGALNALQRPADGVWLAADQLEFRPFAEIGLSFIWTTESAQDQTAVVKGSRVAAAIHYRGVERVERFELIARKERMDTAAIQLVEHGILAESGSGGQCQQGGSEADLNTGHERSSTGGF
jgi:hypothetical protein